jgi:hypothetical protein
VVDVYELTMDKDDRLRYLFDGEWHTLESKIIPMSVPYQPGQAMPCHAVALMLLTVVMVCTAEHLRTVELGGGARGAVVAVAQRPGHTEPQGTYRQSIAHTRHLSA